MSARRAGVMAYAIDLFADTDTVECTQACYRVAALGGGEKHVDALLELIDKCRRIAPDIKIVTGSGFEEYPDLLRLLELRFPVIGNRSETVREVKSPAVFFGVLRQLGLPFPVFSVDGYGVPLNDDLLSKTVGAAGGGHVRREPLSARPSFGFYLQAEVRGRVCSATFLADGASCHVLGYNELWVCDKEGGDFRFAGAVSNIGLSRVIRKQIGDAIRRLVLRFELCGLCGLDFMVDQTGGWTLLELNPRPTATFELYENHDGLFSEHLEACAGRLKQSAPDSRVSRALAVFYATERVIMPPVEWPRWAADRPPAGHVIPRGQALCTVRAEGSDAKTARRQLQMRVTDMAELLGMPAPRCFNERCFSKNGGAYNYG